MTPEQVNEVRQVVKLAQIGYEHLRRLNAEVTVPQSIPITRLLNSIAETISRGADIIKRSNDGRGN